jgi:hypothetical protein
MADPASQPKYAKPRILLIDMPQECERVLREAGYNVSVGTFGVPYSVEPSDKACFVSLETCRLPDYEEQEIIIANTACPEPNADAPPSEPGAGVDAHWQDAASGQIDPRPLSMHMTRRDFQRILDNGGIFIVFLSGRYRVEYIYGRRRYSEIRCKETLTSSNWRFLDLLESFERQHRRGDEIEFLGNIRTLRDLLKRGSAGARYACVLQPDYHYRDNWLPLAKNKYGEDVAGLLFFHKPRGSVLLLPQMPNAHNILVRLLEDFCTVLSPKLFPEFEGSRWIHRGEYEIPGIMQLRKEIEKIQDDAAQRIKELEEEIGRVQDAKSDWYTLLNGTGEELVGAVIRTLQRFGFTQVVDVDQEAKQRGEDRSLREDIQIRDKSPVLIIDVKGVTGHPEDAEATQSEKHALMRAEEFGGKVKALTIINHQRNIPPHDRDQQAYRREMIDNAVRTHLGLMTTWDVFRLLRNKESLGWPDDVLTPVFYRTGRIEPIPEHYVEIGTIVHVWQKAFGIVPSQPVTRNATLGIEVGHLFVEVVAKSLQVDGRDVQEAPAGSNCGIAFENAARSLCEKMRVFLVRQP